MSANVYLVFSHVIRCLSVHTQTF